jgi:hypothetical protein
MLFPEDLALSRWHVAPNCVGTAELMRMVMVTGLMLLALCRR